MSPRSFLKLVTLAVLVLAACLDPLYEDGAPLTSGWVACCEQGVITTCFCAEPSRCLERPFACAGGTCSLTPGLCTGPTGGGGASTGDAGASGGGSGFGGGSGLGGGGATGGGAGGGSGADAGTADAGTVDAGMGGGAGGGSGGGTGGGGTGGGATGGGTGGGGATQTFFELCCVQSRLTTCACPASGCVGAPFTPCPGGACVAGTTTSLCR